MLEIQHKYILKLCWHKYLKTTFSNTSSAVYDEVVLIWICSVFETCLFLHFNLFIDERKIKIVLIVTVKAE